MYQNSSYRRGPRRPGTQSYSNRRSFSSKKPAKASNMHPAMFVKAAKPTAVQTEYIATNSFADFAMHPLLKSNVAQKGYINPSEIQDKTIALGLQGKSIVGIANTGTGKTAAFILPILNSLLRHPETQGLVIAPTRELAMQIEDQARIFAKNSGLQPILLIGGVPDGKQKTQLKGRVRLVIGTPGRIKDHMNQGTLNLSQFNMVVLDEVDRMLDMGFINDVRFILDKFPAEHQAFFFSATLSDEISRLINTFAHEPVVINVKVGETSENVNQDVIRYNDKFMKMRKLEEVLSKPEVSKVLIFGKTKYGVERLGNELKSKGFKVEYMHGGKSQGQRKRALENFKAGHVNILVATDVAARGIDVKEITHVINYDLPQTYEDYIHRIGRAGRAGKTGEALTFVEDRMAQ